MSALPLPASAAYPFDPPATGAPDVAPPLVPARVIRSDAEALDVAARLAEGFARDAALRDRERRLPWAELTSYSASGLGGITVPREHGGAQASFRTLAEVFKRICAADPALGQIPQNHFGTLEMVRHAASPAQQARIFRGVLEGRRLGNAGPERGSKHVLDLKARLRADGRGGFVLDGTKFYSTGALFAHWVPTKALDEQGRLVVAFVERGTPGLRIVDDWSSFGQRTTASGTVVFDGVQVSADAVIPMWRLGDEPNIQGPTSQLIQAAIDAGIANAALRDTIAFVRERARPWADAGVDRAADDPYVIQEIGRLQIDVHAADAVLDEAAQTLDEIAALPIDDAASARASVAVAAAKVLTTEAALNTSEKLFEMAGASATLAVHNLDRHWRNARTHTLHDPVRWKAHLLGQYHLNGVYPKRHSWN